MKKILILLLICALLASGLAGCKETFNFNNNQVQKEPSLLAELRNQIKADGKLLGVAYLGWIEGDAETARAELEKLDYIEDISFIKDIDKYAENEGYRMYAIVPADDRVTITVCKCEFDEEYLPYDGEELIEANGPILVRGNISDTIPNLYVIAKKDSEKVCYTPAQSGMDGRLANSEKLVYDFTPYDKMPEFDSIDSSMSDAVFCGSWTTIEIDDNGEELVLFLDIEPDGTAKYVYGIGNGEILERFEGTWESYGDVLTLNLNGGVIEGVDEPIVVSPYPLNATFTWALNPGGLELTHIDGDVILYGTRGTTFEFYENVN